MFWDSASRSKEWGRWGGRGIQSRTVRTKQGILIVGTVGTPYCLVTGFDYSSLVPHVFGVPILYPISFFFEKLYVASLL